MDGRKEGCFQHLSALSHSAKDAFGCRLAEGWLFLDSTRFYEVPEVSTEVHTTVSYGFSMFTPTGFPNRPRILPLGTCVNTGLGMVVRGLGAVASKKRFSVFERRNSRNTKKSYSTHSTCYSAIHRTPNFHPLNPTPPLARTFCDSCW